MVSIHPLIGKDIVSKVGGRIVIAALKCWEKKAKSSIKKRIPNAIQ